MNRKRVFPRTLAGCCLQIAIVWLIFPTVASADTIHLSGGGLLKGRIVEAEVKGKPDHMIFELESDLRIAVPLSRIRKHEYTKGFAGYAKLAKQAGNDAEKHYQLAKICGQQGLSEQRTYHMHRTIALNPDHSKARAALNYVKSGNGWILYSEQQINRGLILHGGDYRLPEAVAMEDAKESAQVKANVWKTKLRTLLKTAFGKHERRAEEAMAEIRAIQDPLAAMAIAEELEDSRGRQGYPPALRMLWIKKLGTFNNYHSVKALTMAGMLEPDLTLREEAILALGDFGRPSAISSYIASAKAAKTPNDIKNALRALTYFPDPELWEFYVDSLVTQHKRKISSPGGASFSPNNSSYSAGNKEKIEIVTSQNSDARQMLKEIAPGVDYGYDEVKWRNHFASLLNQYGGDIRRDP